MSTTRARGEAVAPAGNVIASPSSAAPSVAAQSAPILASGTQPALKNSRVASVEMSSLPPSASRNSVKESVIIEYADHFTAQLRALYPERRELELSPINEAGIRKFLCTTLRPTAAPTGLLYDVRGASRFVARYCTYEPLDPPTRAPSRVPSPAFTLASRAGDSFDLSILLASLLLGAGYNAAVAVGTAPIWVTLRNTDLLLATDVDSVAEKLLEPADTLIHPSTKFAASAASSAATSSESTNKYRVVAAASAAAAAAAAPPSSGTTPAVAMPPVSSAKESSAAADIAALRSAAIADDALHGSRVHAWVAVLPGARGVEETFFCEPSTGAL